ncbi:four helix bundle protein [Gramella sp. BOM4]|nr:four helix bundle protein [Christiangramia bathymodioli]
MTDLKERTKQFAIDCWRFCSKVPNSREFNAYVNQLIRSSSSVGANYRAAQRAKSTADFINKLKIVEEEADESMYFLEIFMQTLESNIEQARKLHKECKEIVSIVVTSIKTAKSKLNK